MMEGLNNSESQPIHNCQDPAEQQKNKRGGRRDRDKKMNQWHDFGAGW